MALYCSAESIISRLDDAVLARLTDDSGRGQIDEEIIFAAISDASDMADGFLSSRYQIPLETVPGALRVRVEDISVYNLYARRDNVPDHIREMLTHAIGYLRMLSTGEAFLFPPGDAKRRAARPVFFSDELTFKGPFRGF